MLNVHNLCTAIILLYVWNATFIAHFVSFFSAVNETLQQKPLIGKSDGLR